MQLTDENIALYADTLILQVRGGGRELDYSESSVETVEQLLSVSDELVLADTFPETQRGLLVFYNGCYLGEVMARNLGGVWRFADDWTQSYLLFPHGDGALQVHPFDKVRRRVTLGPNENLTAYYNGLKERLATDS